MQATASYWSLTGTNRSNGTQGSVISQLSPGFIASWSQYWGDKATTRYYFQFAQDIVQQIPNSGLSTSRINSTGFGLDSEFKLAPGWELLVSLRDSQNLFFQGVASTQTQLIQVAQTSLGGGLKRTLYQFGGGNIFLFAEGDALVPKNASDFMIYWGSEWRAGIVSEMKMSTFDLVGGLLYRDLNQTTSLYQEQQQEMIFEFGIKWHLYGPK